MSLYDTAPKNHLNTSSVAMPQPCDLPSPQTHLALAGLRPRKAVRFLPAKSRLLSLRVALAGTAILAGPGHAEAASFWDSLVSRDAISTLEVTPGDLRLTGNPDPDTHETDQAKASQADFKLQLDNTPAPASGPIGVGVRPFALAPPPLFRTAPASRPATRWGTDSLPKLEAPSPGAESPATILLALVICALVAITVPAFQLSRRRIDHQWLEPDEKPVPATVEIPHRTEIPRGRIGD